MKITLNKDLLETRAPGVSKLSLAKQAGIHYRNFLDMAKGEWNLLSLSVLARFLSLLFSEDELKKELFGNVFTVTSGEYTKEEKVEK